MKKANDLTIDNYLRGKVGYDVTDLALQSIYLDRGISSGDTPTLDIPKKDRELALADLYMYCASSSASGSSVKEKDGDWSHESTGHKNDDSSRNNFIQMAGVIYARYNEQSNIAPVRIISFGY